MPVPALVTLVVADARTEPIVSVVLLTVMVSETGRVIVPPESTMAPEPDAKVIPPADTVPLTVMVPAPRPVVVLPKLMASPVPVMTLAGVVPEAPLLLVLQPGYPAACVAVHVPPAFPKPLALELS